VTAQWTPGPALAQRQTGGTVGSAGLVALAASMPKTYPWRVLGGWGVPIWLWLAACLTIAFLVVALVKIT
jgi:hypothetical protein